MFDTAALIELLQREFRAHYWFMPLKLAQVHYRTADLSVEDVFAPLLIKTHKLFSALLDQTKIPEKAMGIPSTQHDLDGLRATYGDVSFLHLKAIRSKNGAAGRASLSLSLRAYTVSFRLDA